MAGRGEQVDRMLGKPGLDERRANDLVHTDLCRPDCIATDTQDRRVPRGQHSARIDKNVRPAFEDERHEPQRRPDQTHAPTRCLSAPDLDGDGHYPSRPTLEAVDHQGAYRIRQLNAIRRPLLFACRNDVLLVGSLNRLPDCVGREPSGGDAEELRSLVDIRFPQPLPRVEPARVRARA